jgi:Na+/melibiose symporter-like transporter
MENKDIDIEKQSLKTIAQLQGIVMISNMMASVSSILQAFYTTIVLLAIELYIIANIIFTIWNMFNDPLLGHYCDKSTRWVERYGKRFPFIVIGMTGSIVMSVIVFSVPFANPSENQILVFLWLVIILCVSDTFGSLIGINRWGLFVDKIRNADDRKKAGVFNIIFVPMGILIAVILQPIILESLGRQNLFAWSIQALFFAILAMIIFVVSIPGLRESKEMRERRVQIDTSKKEEKFFRILRQALTQRSFVAIVIMWITYSTTSSICSVMLYFWIIYVLGLPLTAQIVPSVLFIIMAPVTIPIWFYIAKKIEAKKLFACGLLIFVGSLIPMLWIDSLLGTIIIFALIGVSLGCQGILQPTIISDAIDEAAVVTGTRNEGIYIGIHVFFSRTSIAIQVSIVGIIQIITGFNPEATIQTPEAIWGLRLLMSVIPGGILLLGIIIFYILFDVTDEKRSATRARLKELGL